MVLQEAARTFFQECKTGHAMRPGVEDPIVELRDGLVSGSTTVSRSLELTEVPSLAVLEIGCSWGPIVFAAASFNRVTTVVGVDIEDIALKLGEAVLNSDLITQEAARKVEFLNCQVEKLPFADNSFDLIVCHTTIEHVGDVERAIYEMHRVLKPGGVLHLEAPNYLWPFEPHLAIIMPPLGPKWLVKSIARFQGKNFHYIDHLKFVYPGQIERILRKRNISYQNLYLKKLESVLVGGNEDRVVGFRRLLPIIRLIRAMGLGSLAVACAMRLGVYPSIEYRVVKS